MKKLTCTQCGAGINNKTLTCEYCGSVFLSSNVNELEEQPKSNSKKAEINLEFDVRELNNEELASLIKNILINTTKGNIFVVMFMLVWTSVAFTIFISSLTQFLLDFDGLFSIPFLLVPGFFVVIGASIIVKLITAIFKSSITNELILIKNDEHEKARESLLNREQKKHNVNFVAVIILLDYFKLENYSEAKRLIIQMSQSELSALINKSSVFLEIAQNLGVKTPSVAQTIYNGNGYSTTM